MTDPLQAFHDDAHALEALREFRRLITIRLGALALVAAAAAAGFDHPAPIARWALAAALLVPPALARVAERRLARRLEARLRGRTAVAA